MTKSGNVLFTPLPGLDEATKDGIPLKINGMSIFQKGGWPLYECHETSTNQKKGGWTKKGQVSCGPNEVLYEFRGDALFLLMFVNLKDEKNGCQVKLKILKGNGVPTSVTEQHRTAYVRDTPKGLQLNCIVQTPKFLDPYESCRDPLMAILLQYLHCTELKRQLGKLGKESDFSAKVYDLDAAIKRDADYYGTDGFTAVFLESMYREELIRKQREELNELLNELGRESDPSAEVYGFRTIKTIKTILLEHMWSEALIDEEDKKATKEAIFYHILEALKALRSLLVDNVPEDLRKALETKIDIICLLRSRILFVYSDLEIQDRLVSRFTKFYRDCKEVPEVRQDVLECLKKVLQIFEANRLASLDRLSEDSLFEGLALKIEAAKKGIGLQSGDIPDNTTFLEPDYLLLTDDPSLAHFLETRSVEGEEHTETIKDLLFQLRHLGVNIAGYMPSPKITEERPQSVYRAHKRLKRPTTIHAPLLVTREGELVGASTQTDDFPSSDDGLLCKLLFLQALIIALMICPRISPNFKF